MIEFAKVAYDEKKKLQADLAAALAREEETGKRIKGKDTSIRLLEEIRDDLQAENERMEIAIARMKAGVVEADKFEQELMAENERLRTVLGAFLECPWTVDEASIPHKGVDANPEQVAGTMSVSLVKIRKAREEMGP